MLNESLLKELQFILPSDHILTDPTQCHPYGSDNSRRHIQPDVVVFPQSHEEVLAIVQFCHQHHIPLTPRGLGTGTPGGAVPLKQGLVLSLEKMQRIKKMDPDNRVMVVEPGVTNQTVQDQAAEFGFFWPPDPGSAAICTIGGNLAYNSAGPRAVKYGTPRENTLGLLAVTGEGKEIRTGTYTTKGVVGYDLTRLLIGSEGTLAIITEANLKLTPLPETKRTLLAYYQDIHRAASAVSAIMAQPSTPCALEIIDNSCLVLIRECPKEALPQAKLLKTLPAHAQAALIIEVDGTQNAIEQSLKNVIEATDNAGLISITAAKSTQESEEIWQVRKALSPVLHYFAAKKINEDVVVPVSKIPELFSKLNELAKHHHITIVNFGHAGNGNIHVNLMIDPNNPTQVKAAEKCLSSVFEVVIGLGGTLSGEHGIGIEKRDFMTRAVDANSLELMKSIKNIFDPNGILNPGKILPENKL